MDGELAKSGEVVFDADDGLNTELLLFGPFTMFLEICMQIYSMVFGFHFHSACRLRLTKVDDHSSP